VCIAFESSVINGIKTKEHCFTIPIQFWYFIIFHGSFWDVVIWYLILISQKQNCTVPRNQHWEKDLQSASQNICGTRLGRLSIKRHCLFQFWISQQRYQLIVQNVIQNSIWYIKNWNVQFRLHDNFPCLVSWLPHVAALKLYSSLWFPGTVHFLIGSSVLNIWRHGTQHNNI